MSKFSSGVHPVQYNFVLARYILQVYKKVGFVVQSNPFFVELRFHAFIPHMNVYLYVLNKN